MNRKTNYCVRWHDGTYDPYNDNYREVVTKQTYWDWVESNCSQDDDGHFVESPSSNPDVLADTSEIEPVLTEELDALRHKAYAQLTSRQQEVWDLAMRQNYPQSEIAKKLGTTQQAISKLLNTAKVSFTAYLREHTSNG